MPHCKVLMVAEKPSLALTLAGFLAKGPINTRKERGNAVHEFSGKFQGRDAYFRFTSVTGHVFGCDFTNAYNNWDRVEPVELFDAPTIKKESNPGQHMPQFLQKEGKTCDYLVLWLDCDKEGENICFEVMDVLASVMEISLYNPRTVFRAKFSALTPQDITKAFQNLILPNQLESLSVEARMEIDLRIGCAFTRFQTKFFHGKYGDLDSSLISYGPCQTPTLGFCVDRHDKIQSFKPEPYWVLVVKVRPCTTEPAAEITLDWGRDRDFNKSKAQQALNEVKSHTRAKVTDVSYTNKTKPRPVGLNTVELLRICSSSYGIGPHQTMIVAERLYTQGFISYPRTESTAYGNQFPFHEYISMFTSSRDIGPQVQELMAKGFKHPRGGVDHGDHPPITPCKFATREMLVDGDSWRIYDYVVRHFFGSISEEMKYKQTTIKFMIGKEMFTKTGAVVTDPGFAKFMNWVTVSEGYLSSTIKVGDEFSITEALLSERKTSPPDYLTESDLISLMEKHGIGTDASIPTHINNICTRNYVQIGTGRRLIPTQLGIILVHGYQKIDSDLVQPTRRAEIERHLNQIVDGTRSYDNVKRDTITEYRRKFDFFVEHIAAMDELFEACFTTLAETGKPMSKCGRCNRYMKLIVSRPQRLYCSTCKETFTVPQRGMIKLFKEIKCPIDGFELLYMQSDRNERSFPFCPNCYNDPPFEDMQKAMGCNDCSHKTCEHSMTNNTIRDCGSCTLGGKIVLDTGSGPKKYYVACNKCSLMYQGLDKATKIKVKVGEQCDKCRANLVFVEFKPDANNKIVGDKTKFTECVFCGPHLSKMLNQKGGHIKNRGDHDTRPSYGQRGGGGFHSNSRGSYGRGGGGYGGDATVGRGARGGPNRGRGGAKEPTIVNPYEYSEDEDEYFGGPPRRGGRGRSRGRGRGRGARGGSRGRGGGHPSRY